VRFGHHLAVGDAHALDHQQAEMADG
jgi:hypothetical protein